MGLIEKMGNKNKKSYAELVDQIKDYNFLSLTDEEIVEALASALVSSLRRYAGFEKLKYLNQVEPCVYQDYHIEECVDECGESFPKSEILVELDVLADDFIYPALVKLVLTPFTCELSGNFDKEVIINCSMELTKAWRSFMFFKYDDWYKPFEKFMNKKRNFELEKNRRIFDETAKRVEDKYERIKTDLLDENNNNSNKVN